MQVCRNVRVSKWHNLGETFQKTFEKWNAVQSQFYRLEKGSASHLDKQPSCNLNFYLHALYVDLSLNGFSISGNENRTIFHLLLFAMWLSLNSAALTTLQNKTRKNNQIKNIWTLHADGWRSQHTANLGYKLFTIVNMVLLLIYMCFNGSHVCNGSHFCLPILL